MIEHRTILDDPLEVYKPSLSYTKFIAITMTLINLLTTAET